MDVVEFLRKAGSDGPCVGLCGASPLLWVPTPHVEFRRISGDQTDTLGGLLAAFADAWRFPVPVAQNRNAFNDWMRDFDNLTNLYLNKTPATGYLTEITDAHLILGKQPEMFPWFASKIPFYRDYYRDELEPPAAFGLLLSVPAGRRDEVSERWQTAGAKIAPVSC